MTYVGLRSSDIGLKNFGHWTPDNGQQTSDFKPRSSVTVLPTSKQYHFK